MPSTFGPNTLWTKVSYNCLSYVRTKSIFTAPQTAAGLFSRMLYDWTPFSKRPSLCGKNTAENLDPATGEAGYERTRRAFSLPNSVQADEIAGSSLQSHRESLKSHLHSFHIES